MTEIKGKGDMKKMKKYTKEEIEKLMLETHKETLLELQESKKHAQQEYETMTGNKGDDTLSDLLMDMQNMAVTGILVNKFLNKLSEE